MNVKFNTEEYVMAPLAHAKIGLIGERSRYKIPKIPSFAKCGFSVFFRPVRWSLTGNSTKVGPHAVLRAKFPSSARGKKPKVSNFGCLAGYPAGFASIAMLKQFLVETIWLLVGIVKSQYAIFAKKMVR